MRSSFAILIFSIAQIGCGSSYIVSSSPNGERLSFSEFNAAVENKKAKIVFQDGSTLYVQGLRAVPDSTSWLHPITGARAAVPTHKINRIILTNWILGALEGAGIGFLAGGGVGLLTGAILISPNPNSGELARTIAYIVIPAIGGGAGLLVGTIVGVAIGHTYEYQLVNELEKP